MSKINCEFTMRAIVALVIISFAACAYSTPLGDEAIDPSFVVERDVRFLLHTRQNTRIAQRITFSNQASITNSNFRAGRQTRFLVHGWTEDAGSGINTDTAAELLSYNDFNIIIVDWSEGSQTINYAAAANRVSRTGALLASQIDFMQQHGHLVHDQVTVVGFSLGAHIAGHAGKNVRRGRIGTLIGLDPAGPLFSVRDVAGRLDAGDATYVEAIHTDGGLFGAGIGAPIADADYFPNGGSSQSGCFIVSCSHFRAVTFYVESIQHNRFFALRCSARDNISSLRCRQTPGEWMGGDSINHRKSGRGSFYLETNRSSPFAQGPTR